MANKVLSKNLKLFVFIVAIVLGNAFQGSCFAQEPEEDKGAALKRAHESLEKMLKDLDVFYKANKATDGSTYYTVLWEGKKGSSRMFLELGNAGYYQEEWLHRLLIYTTVKQQETPLPPAVIKAVSTYGSRALYGTAVCSGDFKMVSIKCDSFIEGMTSRALGLSFLYVDINKNNMLEIINQGTAGSE